jgi:hypothetical protein
MGKPPSAYGGEWTLNIYFAIVSMSQVPLHGLASKAGFHIAHEIY